MESVTNVRNKRALLVTAVLLVAVYCVWTTWATHTRLQALEQAWEADGPHATVVGQLRARLAALQWLGPLRPHPPVDPFHECGIPPAGDGWRSFLKRLQAARGKPLACLEEHVAEARAEHGRVPKRYLGCLVLAAVVMAVIQLFLGGGSVTTSPSGAGEAGHTVQRSGGPSPARGGEEQPLAGSPSFLSEGSTYSCPSRLAWRRPFDMIDLSPRVINVHERLRTAMKAALSRRRQILEGQRMSYEALDWWRGPDDGRDRLVVQPREYGREKFLPYRYPKEPSVKDPWEYLLPLARPCRALQKEPQHKVTPSPAAWRRTLLSRLLLVLQTMLLAYLCLQEAARR